MDIFTKCFARDIIQKGNGFRWMNLPKGFDIEKMLNSNGAVRILIKKRCKNGYTYKMLH